jgi:hypothetical protein
LPPLPDPFHHEREREREGEQWKREGEMMFYLVDRGAVPLSRTASVGPQPFALFCCIISAVLFNERIIFFFHNISA